MPAQQPGFQARVPRPPTTGNPALDAWLNTLTGAINALPRLSWFSGTHPNLSRITGTAGDLVVNVASASTNSRLWIMGGALSTSTTSSWVLVGVTPVG